MPEVKSTEKKQRVLSGMRPTGRLHIGHYFGALSNWLKLQEEYDCFFFVADWHALTTHYADTSQVAQNTLEVVTDWLSVGINPAKAHVFVQSWVPEHAELHLLLSMITPLGWLERVPTYKEQIDNLKDKDLGTYGFLGYPLLQTADIVMYDADLVPVGEDQVPHVELTREVVRRFNTAYAPVPWSRAGQSALRTLAEEMGIAVRMGEDLRPSLIAALAPLPLDQRHSLLANAGITLGRVLEEPQAMLTSTPRLPGTDGRRMAKSYGNSIWLSEPVESIRAKAKMMMTDPQRVRRTDSGRPEVCPVFSYHKLFSPAAAVAEIDHACRTAEIGCVDCKNRMADGLVKWIAPIQERRRALEERPGRVWDILEAGSNDARRVAKKTMARARKAIFDWEGARKEARTQPAAAGDPGAPGGN
jgi:tryptophanyl-tRNA synthetase